MTACILNHEIEIVFAAPSWCVAASVVSAASKRGGNARPRFVARRRIPFAARGLKKNRLGNVAESSKTCDKEHALASLGEAEILAVQHAPCPHIPALVQLMEDDSEVKSSSGSKEAGNIFKHHEGWLQFADDAHQLKEQSRARAR